LRLSPADAHPGAIDEALEIQRQIDADKYPYTDGAPFVIGKSTSAKLFTLDRSILHSTE
jgi:hypothetical protein